MTDARSVSRAIALASTAAARDKQATDVVVLDVAELLSITDYFVICSASSDRQIKTVIHAVEDRVRHDLDLRPVRREGEGDAGWWLLDYVDVVVHVFGEEQRAYYDLERLWRDAPRPGWATESPARTAG
ncbi:MAG TPA: ribosome silencing factor [Actinomycetota bacterium]|nr:ribosome silencing factor [Actinomycetota bacterium]